MSKYIQIRLFLVLILLIAFGQNCTSPQNFSLIKKTISLNSAVGGDIFDGKPLHILPSTGVDLQGLVTYYKLDETVMTNGSAVQDFSGNSNNGVISSLANSISAVQGTLRAQGSQDYIELNSPNNFSLIEAQKSFSIWLKPENYFGDENIITFANFSNSSLLGLHFNAGAQGINVSNFGGAQNLNFNQTISLRQWHHVAFTFDGTIYRVYFDGALVGTGTIPANAATVTQVLIGGSFTSGYAGLYGYLDEVSIWNRVLSDNEILAISNR